MDHRGTERRSVCWMFVVLLSFVSSSLELSRMHSAGRYSKTSIRTAASAWRRGSPARKTPSSHGAWSIGSGSTCWDAGSSSPWTTFATPTQPPTTSCSTA